MANKLGKRKQKELAALIARYVGASATTGGNGDSYGLAAPGR